jgi:Icc-related predicted phosphoesterase
LKIACVSDLHGHLPEIPECDILLIGGDIVPLKYQRSMVSSVSWMNHLLKRWLEGIHYRGVSTAVVAGNHDIIFERRPDMIPGLPWFYLRDDYTTLRGLKVWGSPWQPTFGTGWAFNLNEADLNRKWAQIPGDTDILLLHGPPHGEGDLTIDGRHVGSPGLLGRILEVKPKLVVCGHIHEAYGLHPFGDTLIVNASLVNLDYEPVNPVRVVEL